MNFQRRAFLPLMLAIASQAALAQGTEGVSSTQVLIGQSISLQGGKDEYGTAVLAGIEAYLQTANRAGGVHGRKIVLKTLDDDAKPALAEANARKLVQQDRVFLLFGSIEGGPSTSVMKAAVDLQVPFFAPIAGSPGLRKPHQPLVFPVRAEHLEEFRALLAYAQKTGISRPAFFRADSETGRQHLSNFQAVCAALGLQAPIDLPFASSVTDAQLDEMARRIAATGAQVVINHGSAGVYERLIRRAAALNVRTSFFDVNSGSSQLVRHLGNASRGMVFSQVVPSPWERKTAITREYQEAFAREKPGQDFSYGSLEGFLTAKTLVAALHLAGPKLSREQFRHALDNGSVFDLGDRLKVTYKAGDHSGLTHVDLAIVTNDLRFRH
ncbi:MAG: ABC transporter substrate-binding protein [Ramlibacter sp.]|nr:ABC transporter substrate-binding protein [Ramlibacter sp.]